MAAGRQLANCSRCLAALARRGRFQSEEAASVVKAPSARLLLTTKASAIIVPVPLSAAPAQDRTSNPALSQQGLQDGFSDPFNIVADASRSFQSSAMSADACRMPDPNAGPGAPHGSQDLPQPHGFQTTAQPTQHLERPATPTSPSSSPMTSSSSPSSSPGDASAPSPRSRFTLHWRFRHATKDSSQAASASPSSSDSSSSSRYSDPKDGSFAGRIVQHDGNHAVHLLVSGTGARDYNLRMVRCHARDELVFGGGAGGAGGGLSSASAGTAVARGENVPFTTFLYRQIRDAVSATFLPAGYPATTGDNYVKFMGWQGINNIAVTANSVLASTFMLYAVGLGAGSIPTAGALNWVLKDGMGQLGTLVFGKTIAHNFDVHSKTWFFLSAVLLQAAAALELLTVLAPGHFLLMGSLANTLKGLAWMAAGSTRSVFHLSFARDNNIADVTAKGTSQYIFASLVGTAGGAVMCAAVGQSGAAAGGCFGLLAAAALASAYMAVQVIPLSTLNATRLQLLIEAFLSSITPSSSTAAAAGGAAGAANGTGAAAGEAGGPGAGPAAAAGAAGLRGSSDPYHPYHYLDNQHEYGNHDGTNHHNHSNHQPTQYGYNYQYPSASSSNGGGGGVGGGVGSGSGAPHTSTGGEWGGGGDSSSSSTGFRRYGAAMGDSSGSGSNGGRSRSRDARSKNDDEDDDEDDDDGYYSYGRHGYDIDGFGIGSSSGSNVGGFAKQQQEHQQQQQQQLDKQRHQQGQQQDEQQQQGSGRVVDRCYIGPSIHEYDMMYDDSMEPKIPTPLELSPLDPPLPYFSRSAHRLSPPIHVGSRLEHVVDGNANLLVMLLNTYKYAHFMVLPLRGGLHVVLHERADPRDMVQAYLQACILRRRMQALQGGLPDPDECTAELRLELQESLAAAERLTTIFMSALEASGWTICKVVVEAQRRRAKW
ncbi:hypothetical protein Agub_g2844 [Astrephomene gubernaculifera]|uniref:Uncharacterized protein n=1 Tax=Astrephomene gubernaculifera TaxID=47775 RepID=A0AAD3DKC8_9CHLO|nr:hypothetical protein Agub_g2844 [Astrephomene gubernaculifera]